jgi:hypothetical protein
LTCGGTETAAGNSNGRSDRAAIGREFDDGNLRRGCSRDGQDITDRVVAVRRAISGGVGDANETTKFVIIVGDRTIARGVRWKENG